MIIGVSGCKQSGKDLVGKIIQYLIAMKDINNDDTIKDYIEDCKIIINNKDNSWWLDEKSNFKIVKFADKLKDIVCSLINCSRDQLEDEEFKNTELGEEWTKYHLGGNNYIVDEKDWMYELRSHDRKTYDKITKANIIKITPRKLLQLLGTDCGRNIIHPNIWINATMNNYNISEEMTSSIIHGKIPTEQQIINNFPNWIITDCRFENEVKAIKDRGGFVIRVNRHTNCPKCNSDNLHYDSITHLFDYCNECDYKVDYHESETALDDYKFDYIIDNNGTIEELTEKVKLILIERNII